MKIEQVLATKGGQVTQIQDSQTIKEAVLLLARENITTLVVTNAEGKLVGILTEHQIIEQAAAHEQVFAMTVGEVMRTDMISVSPKDDLFSVAQLMTEKEFRLLPVVEKGIVLGIVSIYDLVKAQRDDYSGQVDNLSMQV